MKISIIIPIYNTEAYLRECLDSVLVDNAFTGQLICVNDGSTDGSLAILEEYAKRVESGEWSVESFVVLNQENQGQSVARNTGLDKATDDYVLFLDSDDYYSKGAIKYLTGLAKKNPEVDFFYMDCAVSTEGGRYYTLHHEKPVKMPLVAYYDYEYEQCGSVPTGCVCGGFYKREFIERNHLRMLPGHRYEDELFIFEVFMKEGICMAMHVDEPFYNYRIGREGATTARYTLKHFMERRTIVHACYKAMIDADMQTEARKWKIFDLYDENLRQAYISGFERDMSKFFTTEDVRILRKCIISKRDKKLYKLAIMSPRLFAAYKTENLSPIIRRLINRFM